MFGKFWHGGSYAAPVPKFALIRIKRLGRHPRAEQRQQPGRVDISADLDLRQGCPLPVGVGHYLAGAAPFHFHI